MSTKLFSRAVSFVVCLIATLLFSTNVAVGSIWFEIPDAPDGVPNAQNTVGVGALTNIIGETDAAWDDFRDTYCIVITDPDEFYATTSPNFGNGTGNANFDTRLLLWNLDGTGVMANDDIPPGGAPFLSLISSPGIYTGVVDPGIAPLVAGQQYLLSITGFNDNAFDAGGTDIFQMGADFDALHAPRGGAFNNWSPGGATGEYNIELGGAAFWSGNGGVIPEPGALAVWSLLTVVCAGFMTRRRKVT